MIRLSPLSASCRHALKDSGHQSPGDLILQDVQNGRHEIAKANGVINDDAFPAFWVLNQQGDVNLV